MTYSKPETIDDAWLASPLMTREEAAKYLRVHVRTLDRWMREDRLPHVRISGVRTIRVRLYDVVKMLTPANARINSDVFADTETDDANQV